MIRRPPRATRTDTLSLHDALPILAGPGTPGVLSYFNEVPLPATGSLIPTFDMDNIQVLKGPQGTLFGRNAIGGAVLTYSRKTTYDFGGYGEVENGRFNALRIEGAINQIGRASCREKGGKEGKNKGV